MVWFWYFLMYSFCGFLLEIGFAALIRHPKRDRKCFYLLPLCPVYGLGAIAILLLPSFIQKSSVLLIFFGGAAATAVEYLVGVWDEKLLGVRFWDYSGLPGSVDGKISLPFSAAWSLLTIPLVRWLHPLVEGVVAQIPMWIFWPALVFVVGDGLRSAFLLHDTGTTDCLKWYSQPL